MEEHRQWALLASESIFSASSIANALVLLLLSAGNTAIWIKYVNWVHAFPIKCVTLHRLRFVHDAMIQLIPILLFLVLGFFGPKLLLGGSWNSLTPMMWLLVAFCSIGFFKLTVQTIQYQRSRKIELPMASTTESKVVDVADAMSGTKFGEGKYLWLAKLPINEQYHVEFNEKQFEFENLPAAIDGLTILHISDWHYLGAIPKEFFQRVSELASNQPVDLVCFTGDLIDKQSLVEWIPETLGPLSGKFGNYFILGNHDWYQQPYEIRAELTKLGWVDASSKMLELDLNGATVQMGGDETPWMGTQPEFSANADFRILLCHTPDNLQYAREQHVDLMLAGHNHGGQVRLPIVGPLYSPSKFDTRYASGVFWEPPALMHVSRGLSGRHPLRYGCRPEVTRITLRKTSNL